MPEPTSNNSPYRNQSGIVDRMGAARKADLPDDAPGNDRTDLALRARASIKDNASNLDWLLGSPSLTAPSGPTIEQLIRGNEPKAADTGVAASVLSDVGRGLVEGPRQAVGGVRDAAQAMIDLWDEAGDWLESKVPLGGIELMNSAGQIVPRRVGPDELAARDGSVTLPEVAKAETVTGGMIRGISQFGGAFR